MFEVEDFFTPEECDAYVAMSTEKQSGRRKGGFKSMELQSATTSAESQFQQQRTSTTWFHHYATAPELLAKASALLGVEDYTHWEEPQTVRYRPGERFNWHLDALPPSQTGASKGGQRTATILVSPQYFSCLVPLLPYAPLRYFFSQTSFSWRSTETVWACLSHRGSFVGSGWGVV